MRYSGSSSYKYIDKLITNSNNLLIIAPYIDSYYASFIASNSRNKNIKIVSSSIESNALKILNNYRKGLIIRFFFILALLFLVPIYMNLISIILISIAIFLIAIFPSYENIKIKKPKDFVHMKLYIGDNMAITGSANLTYNGTHKNIETIEIITDINEINELKREFYKLWKRSRY